MITRHQGRTLGKAVLWLLILFSGDLDAVNRAFADGNNGLIVMTQNLYEGTDRTGLLGATTLKEFVAAVDSAYKNMLATNPAARLALIARKIAANRVDVVGLQEASIWRTGTSSLSTGSVTPAEIVQFDFVQILLDELRKLNQDYFVAAVLPGLGVQLPDFSKDVRLTDRAAIIVRKDLLDRGYHVTNLQEQDYLAQASYPVAFPPTLTIVTHGDVVVIDLKQSERDRWLQLRNNHRRDIVKLIQRDFEITIDDSADALATFAKLYEQTMRRVSAADHYYFPPSYYHDLLRVRGCRVVIANVRTGGRVSCSGIFVLCANVVSYHLGGTDDEFLSHAPSKLMFWRMANWAAEQHAEYMNLGGGLGGRQDSLFAFKSGFSRFRLPFFTARAVVSRDEYHSVCQRKLGAGVAAGAIGDITGFFPPYRRPDPGAGASELGRRVAER